MRYTIVLVILLVATFFLRRAALAKARTEATAIAGANADRGWTAEVNEGRLADRDITIEGTTSSGRPFVARSLAPSGDTDPGTAVGYGAVISFPNIAAARPLPVSTRKKGRARIAKHNDDGAGPTLERIFATPALAHLDAVRGATMRARDAGESPLVFQLERMATTEEHVTATIDALDGIITELVRAGLVQTTE